MCDLLWKLKWRGEPNLQIQPWLIFGSDNTFICLLRKINKDDVVILDSLNYIKGKLALVRFSVIFSYAFMFKIEMFCRLQIWIILSHQACTDPPLSGEHPRLFKFKISTLEWVKILSLLCSGCRYTVWRQMKWAHRGTSAGMLQSGTTRTCERRASALIRFFSYLPRRLILVFFFFLIFVMWFYFVALML